MWLFQSSSGLILLEIAGPDRLAGGVVAGEELVALMSLMVSGEGLTRAR